jgi:CheY-like chemotaxis protein
VLLAPLGEARAKGGRAMDFAAVLSKPVKPGQLRKALRGLLAPASERPPAALRRRGEREIAVGEPSPLRILLAEDNVVNQKVALMMLERMGYTADVAADGREALDALERQPYDVVLMDVQMPEMDGLEATRRIRERPPEHQPLVIGLTAHAMVGDRERCLEAGMDGYLPKPIQIADLQSTLRGAEIKANQELLEETAPIDRTTLDILRRSLETKTTSGDGEA